MNITAAANVHLMAITVLAPNEKYNYIFDLF